jgi:CheY-like chemotaxis protein
VRVLVPVAPTPDSSPPAETPQGRGTQKRILVVDDDRLVLESVCKALKGAGYQVRPAASADEALAQYAPPAEPFDLVLSDVAMPGMDGFELARRLAERDPHLNLLFLGSRSGHEPARKELLDRFPLLTKPFEPGELLEAGGLVRRP